MKPNTKFIFSNMLSDMKMLFFFIFTAICTVNAYSQECEIPVALSLDVRNVDMPEQSANALLNQLGRLTQSGGMVESAAYAPFMLTVKVDQADKNVLPGPPKQYVTNLILTMFMTEKETNKVYASEYIELTGIGNNENRSLMNAFTYLKAGNSKVSSFMKEGRRRIISYYDSQADNLIREAKRLSAMKHGEQAIAMLVSVPSCSQAYDRLMECCVEIYQLERDRFNEKIYNTANALWSSSQGEEAAVNASYLLSQVDPESKIFPQARKLLETIGAAVASDKNFEQREKYRDSIDMKGRLLETLKAVGVAYGNGQKENTTNLIMR